MKRWIQKILPFVQFIPMALFLYKYKTTNDWVAAFEWGGAVAMVLLAATYFAVKKFDKILLSVNCFLIGGAAMIVFNIVWLQNLYLYLGFTTPLVWFLAIGLITTFSSSSGFIGIDEPENPRKVIALSLLFLVAVCGAIFISIHFQDNMFKGIVLPWIGLMVFRDFLIGEYLLASVGLIGTALLFVFKNGGFKGGIFLLVGMKILKGFLKGRKA